MLYQTQNPVDVCLKEFTSMGFKGVVSDHMQSHIQLSQEEEIHYVVDD